MDLLKDAAKNINLYEIKAYVRKAQNVALNLTEMEAKVREATNNEPWGCPTTLMAQIAAGTYNYRDREEIMGMIFRRFTEKAANEWRQIYKSLQLLEYLIKNGSERIIDDARSNISLIQMLKSFHYIDSKGRDQGINVRNRAKNLINLMNDDSLIRSERKKSRANQKKFGGVASSAYGGASSVTSGPNFDEDLSNRVYGDGGVYGERYDDPAAAYENGNSNENFEEYNVEGSSATSRPTTGSSRVHASASKSKTKPQPQEPQDDLLGDLVGFNNAPANATQPAKDDDDDDEFDDFQAAPSQPQQKRTLSSNLSGLYQTQQPQQNSFAPQQSATPINQSVNNVNYNINSSNSFSSGPVKTSSTSNDAFSSLFSSAKTKTQASPAQTPQASKPTPATSTNDDFFGDFSSNSKPTNGNTQNTGANGNSSNNNGEIDLLSF